MHAYMEISSWKGCNVGRPFLPSQYLIAVLGLFCYASLFLLLLLLFCAGAQREAEGA